MYNKNLRVEKTNSGQVLLLDTDNRIIQDLTGINKTAIVSSSTNTPQVVTGVKEGQLTRPLQNDASVSTQVIRYNFAQNASGSAAKIVFGDATGFVSATLSPATNYAAGYSGNQVAAGVTDLGIIGGAATTKPGFNSMLRALGALEIVSIKAYTNTSTAYNGEAALYLPPAGGLQTGANKVIDLSAQIPVNQGQYQAGVIELLSGSIIFTPEMALYLTIPDGTSLSLTFEVRAIQARTF